MQITDTLAKELQIRPAQAEAAVKLIDEGNTIPFIARYRKEVTGSLNDEVLRNLYERLNYLRKLDEQKEKVRQTIEAQGKLTPELSAAIDAAETLVALEDIYRPYKQKRRTRASIAREKGLEPLAEVIRTQTADRPLTEIGEAYISEEKGVASAEEAVAGACDILAEQIAETAMYRTWIRDRTREMGKVVSTAKDETVKSVYENYYQYEEPVVKIAGHRVLAVNRGEAEKILTVRISAPVDGIIRYLENKVIRKEEPHCVPVLQATIRDAYDRLIAPAVEREIRNELTEKAEDGAIRVFGKNLRQLLMQPPIAGQTVLGWDPAFRTGCKLAVVDPTGKVLDTTVVYPTAPTNARKIAEAKSEVEKMIRKYGVSLISVGNGTASRESEQVIVELLHEIPEKVQYVITNEAGASVYSASKLATEEFPQFDVGQRSAASIARRVQDPLAELVKIDPKAIGVGQYQHDMDQKKLGEALDGVVEACVNEVGVDLNTASAPLMEHISGITKTTAKNIVQYREENGQFRSRRDLLKVPKLGPKAFEQCAGFMRITGGKEPLDATAVHPESYAAAKKLCELCRITPEELIGKPGTAKTGKAQKEQAEAGTKNNGKLTGGAEAEKARKLNLSDDQIRQYAGELGVGEITLRDILAELRKPGRDPREDMPKPVLRSDVLSMEDLQPGMILKGTVRNVIDFGAFVDIGVHQDGLVHISQLSSRKFVKHPLEVVSVGDIVEVKVLSVDLQKKRIALTMKL